MRLIDDERFQVVVIDQSPDPEWTALLALRQDYSTKFVADKMEAWEKDRIKAGEIVVTRLLKGNKGHWGPLEHPNIVFNCGFFPHSVMQQARTHRAGISFDCQSMRYTGANIEKVGKAYANCQSTFPTAPLHLPELEDIFYLRPVGVYQGEDGNKYEYTEDRRNSDLLYLVHSAIRYYGAIESGSSYEQARDCLPAGYRQHFVVSFNPRSLMHFLDLRANEKAQPEIKALAHMMFGHFQKWMPSTAAYYEEKRLGKALLSP